MGGGSSICRRMCALSGAAHAIVLLRENVAVKEHETCHFALSYHFTFICRLASRAVTLLRLYHWTVQTVFQNTPHTMLRSPQASTYRTSSCLANLSNSSQDGGSILKQNIAGQPHITHPCPASRLEGLQRHCLPIKMYLTESPHVAPHTCEYNAPWLCQTLMNC